MAKAAFSKSLSDKAPNPRRSEAQNIHHGTRLADPYEWMRDANWQTVLQDPSHLSPEIRAHLEGENGFYEDATSALEPLRKTLVQEMRGRIREDDTDIPMPDGDFAYGTRYRQGGSYPVFFRTARKGGAETILLDGDKEGEGQTFFDIASVDHSPSHEWIAYGVDRLGSEFFDIAVRRAETGEPLPDVISKTDGEAVWASDSQSFFYIERDDHQRPKWVKRHFLGEPPESDQLVYEEKDDGFFLSVDKSQSGQFIIITASNSVSSECWTLPSDSERGAMPDCFAPRHSDEIYDIDHHGDGFYIHTNANGAVDFKIMHAKIGATQRANWKDWLPAREGVHVVSFIPYKNYMVRLERRDALPAIIIADHARKEENEIKFDEQAYSLGLVGGYEFDTAEFLFTYSSPSTPRQTFSFDMASQTRTLLKTQEIPSGHNPALYSVERLQVTARDGAQIPVTLVRLKSTPVDGTAPLLLYGYGSYGITIPAGFSTNSLSIVDRGAIYAIAHIRGGAAKGRQWYLDGKLSKKQNTFNDFVDVAKDLPARGYGRKNETVIYGGSAGGLLVGAALNQAPSLFGGAIGAVPFIDVVNTISDASLPLTPPEWDEWGNPITDKNAFADIASYSPYDNLDLSGHYPPILATGGLTDYRVTYWEPAKWIARLRAECQGGPFFLKMNMGAGHGGSADRFEQLEEKAHDYAFALHLFGLAEAKPVSNS